MTDPAKIPWTWKEKDPPDLRRQRQQSLNFDLWNYDSNMFNLRRIKSDLSLNSLERFEHTREVKSMPYQPWDLGNDVLETPAKRMTEPMNYGMSSTYHEPTANLRYSPSRTFRLEPEPRYDSPRESFSRTVYTKPVLPENEYPALPPTTPMKTMQPIATAPKRPMATKKPIMQTRTNSQIPTRNDWPIGIYVWGFDRTNVHLSEVLDVFGAFGEVTNMGLGNKAGTRYAFLDYKHQESIQNACKMIPQRSFAFGKNLQVRLRFNSKFVPPLESPVDKSELDNKLVQLVNLPFHVTKAEIENLVAPICDYVKVKFLIRSLDKKSCAFITLRTVQDAVRLSQMLKRNTFFRESKDFRVEYPSIDTTEVNLDKKTIHLVNLPHNINKPEVENALNCIGPLVRIKIFQKSVEKNASVFLTFKSEIDAQRGVSFLNRNPNLFKEMTEPMDIEYPTQDISKHSPYFPSTAPVGLSKKARRQLAADNRIAYCRSVEPFDVNILQSELSKHGPCQVFVTKLGYPSNAFALFATPSQCAEALAAKTMGCNLPRHKRVDFILFQNTEEQLKLYLEDVGDFKNISTNGDICTVEFMTALGAAKAIVRTKLYAFEGRMLEADYSPSLKIEDEISESGPCSNLFAPSECSSKLENSQEDKTDLEIAELVGEFENAMEINEFTAPTTYCDYANDA